MKNIGKPCTGKLYARFDEGGLASRTMDRLLRHRRTKGAETDRSDLRAGDACSLLYPSLFLGIEPGYTALQAVVSCLDSTTYGTKPLRLPLQPHPFPWLRGFMLDYVRVRRPRLRKRQTSHHSSDVANPRSHGSRCAMSNVPDSNIRIISVWICIGRREQVCNYSRPAPPSSLVRWIHDQSERATSRTLGSMARS